MKSLCVIPARMGSSRYPGKPLIPIMGMPMVGHVAKRCLLENVFTKVVVATCDNEIMRYCESAGILAVMTSDKHERASDRAAEAAEKLEKVDGRYDVVVLVQGDEPLVTPSMLRKSMDALSDPKVQIVNLRSKISTVEEYMSPNCVKVVVDKHDNALYFSRAPIPDVSKAKVKLPNAYKQVCIIPFRRDFLEKYSAMSPTYLEEIESVDMNRVIEQGFGVKVPEIFEESYPVDVPEDLIRVEAMLKVCPLTKKYL